MSAPGFAHCGQGTGPIWLDDVSCLGIEPDLFTSGHNEIGNHDYVFSEDTSGDCLGNPKIAMT